MAESNGNGSNVGRVEQVTGVVIDAVFPDQLPEIFSAVTIETSGGDNDGESAVLVCEVQQHLGAALDSVGGVHRHRADAVVAQMLLDLTHQVLVTRRGRINVLLGPSDVRALDDDRVIDLGQLFREHGLDDHALNLLDPADVVLVAAVAPVCRAFLFC